MEKIYEVLRVLNGKPVFLKEHLIRLEKSWRFYNESAMDLASLEREIRALASLRMDPHNIRIEVELASGAFILEAVEGTYPSQEMKKQGVALASFEHQRHNPQVKALDSQLAERVQAYRTEKGVYSLLYIHQGQVGECERANIFFIRDGVLITARDEDVLLGVTRAKVLEIARDLGIPVVKRTIRVDELFTMEAVFMTGTSIHVLPVARIDELDFDPSNKLLASLAQEMDRRVYEEQAEKEETRKSGSEEAAGLKKLYRSTEDVKIAGVCGGLAEYLRVDPSVIRILWIFLSFYWGAGLIAYIAAALVIPQEEK